MLSEFTIQAVKLEQHKDMVKRSFEKQALLAEVTTTEEPSAKFSWSDMLKGVVQSARQRGAKQTS